MSERGSFCTEYIYCEDCFAAVKEVLLRREKYLCSTEIPTWEGPGTLPIVAGKIGGSTTDDEITDFELEYGQKIAKALCHTVRVCVMADSGRTCVWKVGPNGALEAIMDVVGKDNP